MVEKVMADKQNQEKKQSPPPVVEEVSNYLTEMKELPPSFSEAGQLEKEKKVTKVRVSQASKPQETTEKTFQKAVQVPTARKKEEVETKEEIIQESSEEEVRKSRLPISGKDIILGMVNLISLILLVIILFKLPLLADELKKLRVEFYLNQSNVTYEFADVEESKAKKEELESLFVDESGVIAFVNDIEKLKGENLPIQKVEFANQKVIKDRTGNFGVPIVIELVGNWDAISQTLQRIDKLPYLTRAANVDIVRSEEEEGVIVFKYGVFLYVNPSLGESR